MRYVINDSRVPSKGPDVILRSDWPNPKGRLPVNDGTTPAGILSSRSHLPRFRGVVICQVHPVFIREGRYLRSLIVDQVIRGESGEIDWGKVWKLAKMAFKYYVNGENKL